MILSNRIKPIVKSLFQRNGWVLQRVTPRSSFYSQVVQSILHVNCNIVFDIGANVGQFSLGLREVGYKGRIVSFEPLSNEHQRLLVVSANDALWKVHSRVAIGDSDCEEIINISKNSVSSSLLPMSSCHINAEPDSLYVRQENVSVSTLDLISPVYLRDNDRLFIKIDAQGYEGKIIDGAASTLASTYGLLCELSLLPMYEGQALWQDIIKKMSDIGLTLWALKSGFTDNANGRTLQVDAIFLRV
jgi:FkbM family methyltransferase